MKVGVISTTIFKLPIAGYGGLEVVAWHCARGLAEMGHDVYLFCPNDSICPNVTIVPFGVAGTINEHEAYGGYRELKNQEGQIVRNAWGGYWPHLLQMDCIIDHSWQKYAYLLKMEGRLKCPVLGVMHAPCSTMYSSPPPVEKPCLVGISRDQANHSEALYEKETKVCHNGIDIDFYKSMQIQRTDRYLFLARFSFIKCPDLAIMAALEAGVGLDMIGDTTITNEPELFKECMRLAEQNSPNWDRSKGKQIKVIGGVSRDETVYWYSQARAMLHPNMRFREPLGLAPLEAQACGTPVCAWRRGAMMETVNEGKTGYLVNSLPEMVEILKTNKMDGLSRDYCREWATGFSIDVMVHRYNELVQEAVQTGGW
ncbi:glycosyltransferase [Candidatus Parcubacteria bacterium]|nr:MAG: glycosyltransferase [Candidatus Parcubacteria bacterium]